MGSDRGVSSSQTGGRGSAAGYADRGAEEHAATQKVPSLLDSVIDSRGSYGSRGSVAGSFNRNRSEVPTIRSHQDSPRRDDYRGSSGNVSSGFQSDVMAGGNIATTSSSSLGMGYGGSGR
jgi:hypothetical protein